MKFEVISQSNDFPRLHIAVENLSEKQQLKSLSVELYKAQLYAMSNEKSARFNTCGMQEDSEGVLSLTIPLILGGNPIGIVWYPDNDKKLRDFQVSFNADIIERFEREAHNYDTCNELYGRIFGLKTEKLNE